MEPQQPVTPQNIDPTINNQSVPPPSEQPQVVADTPTLSPVPATPIVGAPISVNPTQPQPVVNQQPSPTAKDPGKILAIVAIVVGVFIWSVVGLILSIVANSISKKAGFKNTIAKVGIWLNSILLFIQILLLAALVLLLMVPAINSRATAISFSDAVRTGDCAKAITYTTTTQEELASSTKFCEQIKPAFGTSQNEIESETLDGKRAYLYSIENGTSKYLRLVVESGKVIDVTVSNSKMGLLTPLNATN